MSQYWYWEKALPKELCNMLVAGVNDTANDTGLVFNENGSLHVKESVRNNKVGFLERNHWVEGILLNYARYANESAGWKFLISDNEDVQISAYKAGEKYDWHTDVNLLDNSKGYHRKLTVVCQLSAPEDFKGGGLFLDGMEHSVLKNQGDIAVFPSFIRHKAEEVTEGLRVTLACWVLGDCFK